MKPIHLFFLTTLLLIISCEEDYSDIEYLEPTGRRLRIIMEEKFPDTALIVGVTSGLWAFDYSCAEIVDKEFSYLTPENDFKQSKIHPDNSTWNLKNAETWIQHANSKSQIVRMHCPIGPQVSEWTKEDSRTSEELKKNLDDFLVTVCTTFNKSNCVKYMDVVNETIKKGAWFGPVSGISDWENPWTRIGYDTDANKTPLYIKRAFEITNKFAPNIKQLYNHHEGPENNESWELIKETVLYLRENGLRVDAIGWQAHVTNGWATQENLNSLSELIDWAQTNSLEFHITEASSFIINKPTEKELQLQAETYSKIFGVLLEKCKKGKVGWNTWHLTDAHTYRSEYFPSLFDKNFNPKPAYYAIQNELEKYK